MYHFLIQRQLLSIRQRNRPKQTSRFCPHRVFSKLRRQLMQNNKTYHFLELRSLRRGALQLLSTMGTPEEILMIFSGHSSIATLRRYLGYQPAAEVAERCILASVGMLRKDSPPEPDTSSTITVDARPRRSSLAYTRTCTETGPSTRRT